MPDTTQRITLEYTITFTSPFHFGTGLGNGLIDRVVRRNDAGLLVTPGSTIKGVVREHCERLTGWMGQPAPSPHVEPLPRHDSRPRVVAAADPHDEQALWATSHTAPHLLTRIFGDRGHPGTLYFDDAVLVRDQRDFFQVDDRGAPHMRLKAWQVEERTRVSMSRLLGTARPIHLFTSEYGLPSLRFDGSILGAITDWPLAAIAQEAAGSFALLVLVAGLLMVERLGGGRSSGAGACRCSVARLLVDDDSLNVDTFLENLLLLGPDNYYELAMAE